MVRLFQEQQIFDEDTTDIFRLPIKADHALPHMQMTVEEDQKLWNPAAVNHRQVLVLHLCLDLVEFVSQTVQRVMLAHADPTHMHESPNSCTLPDELPTQVPSGVAPEDPCPLTVGKSSAENVTLLGPA